MRKSFSFGVTPSLRYRRTRFDLSHSTKTSMNVGTLYPIDVTEVLPGDTFSMHTAQVARVTSAFLKPVMDNCYMDVYYFFVPNRLVYDKWQNVFGQNDDSAWSQPVIPEVPTTTASGTIVTGSVADYMGLPIGAVPNGINILPFRAFALIYNQWFRNENVIDPMHVQKGSTATSESFNAGAWSPSNYMGMPPKVGKRKDYFTSCLPAPQKGSTVELPLGALAPVITTDNLTLDPNSVTPNPTMEVYTGSLGVTNQSLSPAFFSSGTGGSVFSFGTYRQSISPSTSLASDYFIPANLWADLSEATASNVNDLRFAFQLQKYLEKNARFGTRYNEFLLGHFGVSNPDSRLQLPEFLGGARMPINVQQVAQTNTQQGETIDSPLAALGAYSHSVGKSRFTKSFTEHGFVIVTACIRQMHTYQQGIQRMWQRKSTYDYYDPLFANLGEQPVYQSELFSPGASGNLKGQVFGYNEAWADYRYKPSLVTGEMRSGVDNTLDIWHFADLYSNAPVLSQSFIEETPTFFDRTVAVPSTLQDNFIVDFFFDFKRYSVLPMYSVPGLIDHH